MRRTNYFLLGVVMLTITLPTIVGAQRDRGNLSQTLKRLEKDSDRFTKSLDSDLDRSPLDGTRTEDDINGYIRDFEKATDQLKARHDDEGTSSGLAREVLVRGQRIDRFIKRYGPGPRSRSDWRRVRTSLDQLARAYRISWRW